MTDFSKLDLIEPLRRALLVEGYLEPTSIQAQSIPYLIAGRDLLGVAQTGTGKTAAFVLPMLQSLTATSLGPPQSGKPRALILAPTRELAIQIGDSIRLYGKFLYIKSTTIFGGVSKSNQIRVLERGVDILVATPGRLLDLINQKKLKLSNVEIYVLDEADRMLDMGFIADVQKITRQVPEQRQTLLFSATMPKTVTKLAGSLLKNPIKIKVQVKSPAAERIDQRVLFVEKSQKRNLLRTIFKDNQISRALVFTRTKHGANRVAKLLEQNNIRTGVIHGNKSQTARQEALRKFKKGNLRTLVATDIAARGIDFDDVTHVVNFDLPNSPETYIHRIGRTARAGAKGQAISFCDEEECEYLFDIEKTICKVVNVEVDHPYHAQHIADGKRTVNLTKAGKYRQKLVVNKSRLHPNKKKKKFPNNKSENNTSNGSKSKNTTGSYARKKRSKRARNKTLQS